MKWQLRRDHDDGLRRVGEPDSRQGSVAITRFGREHVEATWCWLEDPELRAQIDTARRPTRDENEAYWAERLADPRHEVYAVCVDERHVGNCGLRVDAGRRKAELWMYLGESRRGGVGAAAAELLLARAFNELGLNRAFVRVISSNPGAERFWRRRGFVEEGRSREDTWIEDRAVDSIWLGLLAREWRPGHNS